MNVLRRLGCCGFDRLVLLPIAVLCLVTNGTSGDEARLYGKVFAKQPISHARVIVASPAMDMRDKGQQSASSNLFEATTDDRGEYSLTIPLGDSESVTISMDVRAEGYQTVAGPLMSMGRQIERTLKPGDNLEVDIEIWGNKSLFVLGRVLDENGKPISDVEVTSTIQGSGSTSSVSNVVTKEDGVFRVYDFPLKENSSGSCIIEFRKNDYVGTKIEDVQDNATDGRFETEVVLKAGNVIEGVVVDSLGRRVAGAFVNSRPIRGPKEVMFGAKCGYTLEDGSFRLAGIPSGGYLIRAVASQIEEFGTQEISLDGKDVHLVLVTSPVVMEGMKDDPYPEETVFLFGMKLASATPKLEQLFDLTGCSGAGVVVLDPGPNVDALKIGDVKAGDSFFVVGETKVHSIAEFIGELNKAISPKFGVGFVRVVYSFRSPADGRIWTNTQYLQIDEKMGAEIRAIHATIAQKKPSTK